MGIVRLVRCRIDLLWLSVLQRHFGFDPWHAQAPYSCRSYKRTVVDIVNRLAPATVVEIGTGLGELLAHIDAPRRFGYDIDPGVVRAARFLHRRGITFVHGDARQVIDGPIDVLILVNWIHNLSPNELSELLEPLVPRTTYLLLDAIDVDGPSSYRYKHTFDFLSGNADLLSITRAPDEPRSFRLFRVKQQQRALPAPA
jgi:SAM-dependent methyltransferase